MEKTFIFVKALEGKSEKGFNYNFIVVSNGILAGNLSNPNKLTFEDYKEGDEIRLKVDIKPNGKSWDVSALEIVS